MSAETPNDALVVENLNVVYKVGGRDRHVIGDLSFRIGRGEAFGLVGESGCGKSTVALAAVRYLARNGRINKGRILIDGRDLMALPGTELRQLRSSSIAMVYQETSLVPTLTVAQNLYLGDEKFFNRLRGTYIEAQQFLQSLNFPVDPTATVADQEIQDGTWTLWSPGVQGRSSSEAIASSRRRSHLTTPS